jgi:hypothetical protein
MIKNTIVNSYIEGLQNEGDTLKIDEGFHPEFALMGMKEDGSLRVLPIGEWRAYAALRAVKGDLPRPDSNRVSAEFDFVDITRDVAVAKLQYFEGDQHTYTDYITLYKVEGQWKMVAKFYSPTADKN